MNHVGENRGIRKMKASFKKVWNKDLVSPPGFANLRHLFENLQYELKTVLDYIFQKKSQQISLYCK